jgi:hypothetical protein
MAYLGPRPNVEGASFGTTRAAVERARQGLATQLEGNAGMSVDQAFRYARSLLEDGDEIELRVDGLWLYVEPNPASEAR